MKTARRCKKSEVDRSPLVFEASITFNEPWSLLRAEAELWRLNANTGPGEYELASWLHSVLWSSRNESQRGRRCASCRDLRRLQQISDDISEYFQ